MLTLPDPIDVLIVGSGHAGIAAGALALTSLFAGGQAPRLLGCAAAGACLGFLPLNYLPVTGVPMDGRVLSFAVIVSLLTSVLFGMLPVLAFKLLNDHLSLR